MNEKINNKKSALKTILNVLYYWIGIPFVLLFTTYIALDSISSPSTFRLILGLVILIANGYTGYIYMKHLATIIITNISKENKNA